MNYEQCWVSHPHEWQPLFEQWHSRNPERTALQKWEQYGGQNVVALTITGKGGQVQPQNYRFRLLVTVPHPHEPASTAAAVNLASQLFEGTYLDGTPTALPVDRILKECLITLMPDTNPQGRARSPYRWYDGSQFADEDAWVKWIFGTDRNGGRFGRYAEWRLSEHAPQQVGIEYEQVDADLYVEPNTSRLSTHSKAIDDLYARYGYTHGLEMHQYSGRPKIHLPAGYARMTAERQKAISTWAGCIIEAWQKAGGNPHLEPVIPYQGGPRQQLFIQFWEGRGGDMLRLVTEVCNNKSPSSDERYPMSLQFDMAKTALEATLTAAVDGRL